jgi:predicted RNA-binding protein YlxR (DUF448 family)
LQTRQPPQRTCLACRTTGDKRELIRLVRTPEGRVEVDLTGKKPGRGAYICPQAGCWDAALKKGRLDAALRTKLGADDRLKLSEFATTLHGAVAI